MSEQRLYLIQSAEKGIAWMRLRARGKPGHGSFLHDDNAVTKVAEAVARLGNHTFPLTLTDTVRAFLGQMRELTGLEFPEDDLEGSIAKLGPIGRIVGATMRDTANPTMLKAGYKANVIPSVAEAVVDCRVMPGPAGGVPARGRRAARPGRHPRVGHRPAAGGDRSSRAR